LPYKIIHPHHKEIQLKSREISIQLPESVFKLLELQAGEEFFTTSDDAVRLIVHRAIVYHVSKDVDAKQVAQDLVDEKHKPKPPPMSIMPSLKDEPVSSKTTEAVKKAQAFSAGKNGEKQRIEDVELPQRYYQGNPNGQWVALGWIIERAWTQGYWEKFIIADVATGARLKLATTKTIFEKLEEKGWIIVDNDKEFPIVYRTTMAARRWAHNKKQEMVTMGLIRAIEREPKDEHYTRVGPEPIRISNGKDHMPL
jgi:hypothetical protein